MIGWLFYFAGMVAAAGGLALRFGLSAGFITLGVLLLFAALLVAIDRNM